MSKKAKKTQAATGAKSAGSKLSGGAHPADGLAEFTLRAVVAGALLGVIFGAANAYLGLKIGMTLSSSIPAAVMTIAVFRALRMQPTILEVNMSQTIASSSTALATGTIFTIPALVMWGQELHQLQITALAFLGGVLGIAAMIPLRRLLIVEAHRELPYPEGTACAEVLRVTTNKGVAGARYIFWGILLGGVIKLVTGLIVWTPGEVYWEIPVLPRGEIGLEIAPAILAVGYILGFRPSGIILAGAALSALVLTPLIAKFGAGLAVPMPPETKKLISAMDAGDIWSKYVRYIGAGAVAMAGLLTVAKTLPEVVRAFRAVLSGVSKSGLHSGGVERTDRDLPGWVILLAVIAVVLLPMTVPGIFAGNLSLGPRVVCAAGVGLFGILFVTVAARIVGIVGVTSQPTSGIALMTLLGVSTTFVALGWTGPGMNAAVLTVGTIVTVAASKAGDISQDLKTGWLVGATPAKQQLGQLIGAATACWAVAATLLLLSKTYKFGGPELGAPQATLMKTLIDGVMQGQLPWDLVLTGAGITITATLCGIGGLAFAIGVYLPFAAMFPVFLGGCVRALADKWSGRSVADHEDLAEAETNSGVLAASGLVAGEGLAGIAVALSRFIGSASGDAAMKDSLPGWLRGLGESYQKYRGGLQGGAVLSGDVGKWAAVGLMVIAAALLLRAGSRRGDKVVRG